MNEIETADFLVTAQQEIEKLAKHYNVEESRAVEAYGHLCLIDGTKTPILYEACLDYIRAITSKSVTQLTHEEGRIGLCLGLLHVKQKPFLSDKNLKLSRNALCPCNSGAKFKNCCLDETKKQNYMQYKQAAGFI